MILDAEYIKEQAHKPCFWSDEYGFDVVAFTHAMEQNYSNRVGAKINALKKELAEYKQDAERYRWLCGGGLSLLHPAFAARSITSWKTKSEIDADIDRARSTK